MKLIFSVILLNPVYSKIISVAFLLLFLSKCRKKHQKTSKARVAFSIFPSDPGGGFFTSTSPTIINFPITFNADPAFSVMSNGQTGVYVVEVYRGHAQVSWMTMPSDMAVWFITIGH